MSYYVRLMRKGDVPQVNEIDHEAFANWWALTSYEHELENNLAHYIVACDDAARAGDPGKATSSDNGLSGITSRIKQLFNHNSAEEAPPQKVLGFTGFRIMAEEAHIISIAVREAYRRQGIGKLMLMHAIDMAKDLGARFVTLEARISNTIAQNLYLKYGFTKMGIRRDYYTDNREDAIIMSTGSIASVPYQSMMKGLKQAYTERWGIKFPEMAQKL